MNETKLQSPTPDLNHSTQSETLLSVSMKEEMKEEAEEEEEEEEEEKYHPSLPSSPSNTTVMPPSSPYSSFNHSYSPQRSISPPSPQNPASALFPPFSPLNSTPPPYCNSSLSFSSSQLPHSPQSPHRSSGASSYGCSPSPCRSPPPPHSPPASPCQSPPPSPYTPGDPTCTPTASRSTPVSIPSTPVTPSQPPDSPHSQEDSSVNMSSVHFASSPHRSQSSSQPAPTTPPEQEVVDVESYQPCVVDLTHEEDETDEVDVVGVVLGEPSVIYMGTETRRPRRHNQTAAIANLPPRPERPRAAHPTSSTSSNSSSNYASHRPSESNTFNSTSTNNTFNSSNNSSNTFNSLNNNNLNLPVNVSINNQNNNLDFHNTNLLFGNLLDEDLSVETVEEYGPTRPGPTRPSPLYPLMSRELRHPARHSRRSRSRSPQPDYNRDRDAPRTPEFLQELDDLLAEMEGRMPPPAPPPPAQPQASAPQILPLHQQQPLTAAQMVAQEHCNRVANLMATQPLATQPLAPPSPPPREQPTISCMVCLDSLATIQASSRTMCSTNCGHLFCSPCITEVVKQKKQCPVCRKKLTKKQYHPLFI
ncbi:hypothetical protein Pcinc_022981 [Petrolisthes cinctipes]|uniref:RING-type domain-containing protein n=1 Tax=Petrolisthes cinctipes TaxID=88211 RepID=A0AAE1FD63_PETCI|nr:hypothetical protein Pcinc_022981 [Petrolisthes cinctipes]